MSTGSQESLMNCFKGFLYFRLVPGRYINTISIRECQKGFDSINMIVSELLSEGNFYKKKMSLCLTLSIRYSDSINKIVDAHFFGQIKNIEKPSQYLKKTLMSTGLRVPCFSLGIKEIDGIYDVF